MDTMRICELLRAFDPYGTSELTPAELPGTIEELIDMLFDYYVGGDLIPPNDLEFLKLIMDIERS